MNKLFLFIIFTSISLFSFSQISADSIAVSEEGIAVEEIAIKEAQWIEEYKKAAKISKKENKPILIFFTGSDYCGLCKQLNKHFFTPEEFIKLADEELVLYIADFPRRKDIVSPEKRKVNEQLKSKYAVGGYPTIVLVSSDGKILGKRMGFGFDHDTQYHFDLVRKAVLENQ